MRALFLAALLSLGFAPLQCGSGEPDEAREETPPEALYGLSERFEKAGDTRARETTLRYLIERYPSSRFAERARNDLARQGAAEK